MSNFLNNSSYYGNVSINIGTPKRDRSPSAESDSSTSSLEVKRVKKINYFLGHGEKEWTPKNELIVDDVDLTRTFKKFRSQSIAEVEQSGYVNSLRILSFSHIFPVNKFDQNLSVTKYFKNDISTALRTLTSHMKPNFKTVPPSSVLYCKRVADQEGDEDDDNDNNEEEEDDQQKKEMATMLKDLVKHELQYRILIPSTSEATFSEKYTMPALRRVLLQNTTDDLVYGIIDKNDHNGKKPDFMIGSKIKKKAFYFFFVEIKRPDTTSKYQAEDDYTKLMKQLKQSVDVQLGLGISDPASLGLLVEGFKCTLFLMKLLAHGVYVPVAIKRFTLIEEMHELVLLPSIVEALYFVKLELEKFVVDINQKRKSTEKTAGRELVCSSFVTKFETKKA